MTERILFISPYCGKIENALSKHSNLLLEKLTTHFETDIITSLEADLEYKIGEVLYLKNWQREELKKASEFLLKKEPGKVIFQYVPNMYNPRGGINPFFAHFITRIPAKIEVIGFFHELYYPLLNEIKSFILHPIHKYQLRKYLSRCNQVVTTTEEFAQNLVQINSEIKPFILPAYSNIERTQIYQSTPTEKIKIAIIGGLHPSKMIPEILKQLISQKTLHESIEINLFGIQAKQLPFIHTSQVKFHGHLSDREFSQELGECDLVIAYFSDGLSTRRGSVMTAIQHGIPVISSMPRFRREYSFSCDGITLLPRNFEEFMSSLTEQLHKFKRVDSQVKSNLSRYYESTFSADTILERLHKNVLRSL